MNQRGHLIISGRVQGVCFRLYACETAERLGITGWVRNLRDGRVEVLAEGEEAPMAEFLEWCRKGPPHAQVTGVEESHEPATGEFRNFRTAHGSP